MNPGRECDRLPASITLVCQDDLSHSIASGGVPADEKCGCTRLRAPDAIHCRQRRQCFPPIERCLLGRAELAWPDASRRPLLVKRELGKIFSAILGGARDFNRHHVCQRSSA